MNKLTILAIIVGALGGFLLAYVLFSGAASMDDGMEGMEVDAPPIPAVGGFAEGEEIAFIHPEVSDPEIGELLTSMMDSPVLVVPALADVPDDSLANVYVFTNGREGTGPLGFQPDVFDSPPGSEGYSPLRRIHMVTWVEEESARTIQSASELEEAENQGEVEIEETEIVANMPFLRWSNGER